MEIVKQDITKANTFTLYKLQNFMVQAFGDRRTTNGWLMENPNNPQSELGKCIFIISQHIQKALKPLDDADIENSKSLNELVINSADRHKVIERNAGAGQPTTVEHEHIFDSTEKYQNFRKTIQEETKRMADERNTLLNSTVEITPEYPKNLPPFQLFDRKKYPAFEGLVVPPQKTDKND